MNSKLGKSSDSRRGHTGGCWAPTSAWTHTTDRRAPYTRTCARGLLNHAHTQRGPLAVNLCVDACNVPTRVLHVCVRPRALKSRAHPSRAVCGQLIARTPTAGRRASCRRTCACGLLNYQHTHRGPLAAKSILETQGRTTKKPSPPLGSDDDRRLKDRAPPTALTPRFRRSDREARFFFT